MPCRRKCRVSATRLLGRWLLKLVTSTQIRAVADLLIKMEQASVEDIFDDSPEAESKDPVACESWITQIALCSNVGHTCDYRPPERRNDPPGSLAERLQKIAKQGCRVTTLVVAWSMDLLEVEIFLETTVPDLHQQRLVEVEELVLLEVQAGIGLARQVFGS